MTVEFLAIGAALIWWTLAVVIFVTLADQRDSHIQEVIAVAAMWPIFTAVWVPVLLWRIPFRTAKAIRTDLRNRKLLGEFNEWLERRDQDAQPQEESE
ncbi:hypothetical protein PXK01_19630 [Phaeobacter sp. PT47_59]|uniref:hypothetical protein n=1 Tax=Phaeobacter sp. PT47_59 TaxID=3029979 RepID=UPI00237FE21C|nr:hypothetical protein [Phaeobacter sp. PT47_59]MDE4176373.1 hypothetical protein [Phaeobacter sp. PT47_59]